MSWRQKKCYRHYLCNIWHGNKLWRQPAEIIQLVAKTKKGTSFSTFTMPTKDIFSDVLHVNKFNVSWVAGNVSVPWRQHFANSSFSRCLRLSIDFLADSKGSCHKTVLNDHNSAPFDAHILLRTIQDYTTELLQTLRELNIHLLIVLSRSATW